MEPSNQERRRLRPATEAMYVDGTYILNHESWHEEDAAWKAAHVRSILIKHALEPESECDVGRGTCSVLFYLSGEMGPGVQLTGFNLSANALALASTHTQRPASRRCA